MTSWLVTGPTVEPIALDEAKVHLRVDDGVSDDDNLITTLVAAARQWAENFTGRAFITQTWRVKLDRFPSGAIVLPKPPVTAVTSITYVDTTGTTQTLSSSLYATSLPTGPYAAPASIEPAYSTTWPSTRDEANAVTVEFICGYGAGGSSVPAAILAAMKLRLGTLYEHREGIIVGTSAVALPPQSTDEYLLWPFKVFG